MKILPKDDYLPYAPDHTSTVRINHDTASCSGSSKSLKITRNPDGSVSAKCYRCHSWGKHAQGLSKYSKAAKALGKPCNIKVQQVYLPHDCSGDVTEWPVLVRAKLNEYWITQDDIKHYQIGWSSEFKRLIFPVYHDGNLVGWQGRSYDEGVPKYITRYKDMSDLFTYLPARDTVNLDRGCVIVEDFFSGIRVARHANALVMLGADVGDKAFCNLIRSDSKFLIFNDWDNRIVKMKAIELKNRLTAAGKPSSIITSAAGDPKELDPSTLGTYVSTLDRMH